MTPTNSTIASVGDTLTAEVPAWSKMYVFPAKLNTVSECCGFPSAAVIPAWTLATAAMMLNVFCTVSPLNVSVSPLKLDTMSAH